MTWLESLILGLIQGLTEFLPVSSSGHLEIGKVILGTDIEENLLFTVIVHGATVLSTIVIFRKEIWEIIIGVLKFKMNTETKYAIKIIISMIPVVIIGLFFEEQAEQFFGTGLLLVGIMLLVTASLLGFTYYAKQRNRDVSYRDSFIIGIAQAIAVLPGISRSGATIATGLLLGIKKEETAKFSFLMVLAPIIGANILSLSKFESTSSANINVFVLLVGFIAAFVSGLFACKMMINIVKKQKLTYFAVYCFIVGSIAIIYTLI